MPKLKTSEATKKRYWRRKNEDRNEAKKRRFLKSILRRWDSRREGTAISDGEGWYRPVTAKIGKIIKNLTPLGIIDPQTQKNRDKRERKRLRKLCT